jgi:hypothetical protein
MAEFQWWLLLLGLVAGGGLVAVVFLDESRREEDVAAQELPAEATWISHRLREEQATADAALVERVLLLDREYRRQPPPDRIVPGG